MNLFEEGPLRKVLRGRGLRKSSPDGREHFEGDLRSMLEKLGDVRAGCEFWSKRLRAIPAVPLDKSVFIAYAVVGLEGVAKDAETAIKFLEESIRDLWRYSEYL